MKPQTEPEEYTCEDGTCEWRLPSGALHRKEGPAVIRPDGSCEWRQNDQLHREDGPAVMLADGSREWWRNGLLHREDGPAIEWVEDNFFAWYLDGEEVSQEEVENLN